MGPRGYANPMRQRKKLDNESTTAETKKVSKTTNKKTDPEPEPEATPKGRAKAAIKKAVEAVEKMVTKPARRKKGDEVAAKAAPIPEPVVEAPIQEEKPKRPRRAAASPKAEPVATPAPAADETEDDVSITFRKRVAPVKGKTSTAKAERTELPKPVEKAAKPAEKAAGLRLPPPRNDRSGGVAAPSDRVRLPAPTGESAAPPKPEPKRPRAAAPKVEEEGEVTFRTPKAGAKPAPKAPVKPAPKAKAGTAQEDKELAALLAEFKVEPIQWREASAKRPSRSSRDEDAPEATPEGRTEPRGRSRRDRGRRKEAAPVAEPAPVATREDEDDDLPVVFRSRDGEPAKIEPPKPVVPEVPVKPQKPIIPIPTDGPQVIVREGVPTLVRDHRVYPPLMFFGGARDEQKAEIVFNEMRMAGEAGVHLHSHLIDFEVDFESVNANVSLAAYLLKKTVDVDPEAQVLFRLVFLAPPGWQDKYPNATYREASGQLADPSVCDDSFWDDARDCLFAFASQLQRLDLAKHILGVHLDRGEWFHSADAGYDISRAARRKFQDWARMRYFNDPVALRASWFDGRAHFDDLQIPPQPDKDPTDKFVRANRKERPWVDYHLFLSDQTVERIAELAYAAKEASNGYFLVGVSYGYTFEWSHPDSGHLSLGKLLRTPEIDFIAGPPSYRNREPGGSASFPCPVDSFALNGKLYLSEEDFKTSIGGAGFEPDDFNPTLKTPQALESVHWRGVGAALAHNSGVCWMDLWGNGWLKTPSTWERAKQVLDVMVRRMACPNVDPDVAVFIDERSLAYLVDQQGFSLLVHNVRESVMRAGMSAAFYLLSDLQHRQSFPESKLYVFLNAWDIRPELRAAIKQRLQKDDKVLFWLYSAGLFDTGRESLERAREVTGIALKPQPFHSRTGTTILNRRHPLSEALPDHATMGGARLEPSYFAIPDDGVVLGEYTQTGLPSFVFRQFKFDHDRSQNWSSVFLGEPIVTPGLLRALGQMAGAHVWNFTEDVVHVRAPFLTVHCTGAGQRTITLPQKWSAFDLTEEVWVSTDSTSLRFHGTDGSTHVFMVGVREELEHILSRDPAEILHIEEIIRTTDDTIRYDTSFDVPIMRLDEWMEGNEGDEGIGEDLLFKPRLIEEEIASVVEEPNRVGRRRRRGRGSRGGSEETSGGRREHVDMVDPDLDLGVMFRKKN